MKIGNVILLIVATIFTFIGLAFNKIYNIYIKKNILVQGIIYLTFTLLAFKILYWIAKPLYLPFYKLLRDIFSHTSITFIKEPSLGVSVFVFLGISFLCIYLGKLIQRLQENE